MSPYFTGKTNFSIDRTLVGFQYMNIIDGVIVKYEIGTLQKSLMYSNVIIVVAITTFLNVQMYKCRRGI